MHRSAPLSLSRSWLVPVLAVLAPAAAQAQVKLLPADGAAEDRFGASVALDGPFAVLSAPSDDDLGADSGSAYVLERVGAAWVERAKLLAQDGAAGDSFGTSVSLSGGLAVVGAPQADALGADSGAAYVFALAPGGWTQVAKLTPQDGAAGDWFGAAVAVQGERVVVGARGAFDFFDGTVVAGAAYVFESTPSGWVERAKLTASDGFAGDWFGAAVGIEGGTIVVGAPYEPTPWSQSPFKGAAYVFEEAAGAWSQTAKLLPAGAAADDHVGASVAISGERVVLGAPDHDDPVLDGGAVFVFDRTPAGWVEQAQLVAETPGGGYGFASTVALEGSRVVVGASSDFGASFSSGAAYVFREVADGWVQSAKLIVAETENGDQFAGAVALSGDTLLVGAMGDDDFGSFAGAAYALDLPSAACTFRGGVLGTNPADFECANAPRLGGAWRSRVSTTPLRGTTVLTLLAVGLGGPTQGESFLDFELLALPPFGPVFASESGLYSIPLPFGPHLLGAELTTQGVRVELLGSEPFVVLTNAQDLLLGL